MSVPPDPKPSDGDPEGRLTDPRPIQPGPEGEWPFPSSTSGPDTSSERGPTPPGDGPSPDVAEDRGLVDPRPEASGPDLLH